MPLPSKPNRFYKTRTNRKVKRTSVNDYPSFAKQGRGTYEVTKRGKRIPLTATIENKEFGFDLNLKTERGRLVGTIWVDNLLGWSNYHRRVSNSYKGLNLGKLLFRLSEQEVKHRGGKELQIVSNQQDTVTTALALGYKLNAESEARVRLMLGILPTAKQPTNQQIINAFKSYAYRQFPQLKVVREIK
jgi:hypothetical protein